METFEDGKRSYFAAIGKQMHDTVYMELNLDAQDVAEGNSLFWKAAVKILLRYVTYLPLWTGLLMGKLDPHSNQDAPMSTESFMIQRVWRRIG